MSAGRALPGNEFTTAQKRLIVEALVDCPSMATPDRRALIVAELGRSIATTVDFAMAVKAHALNILATVLAHADGLDRLVDAIEYFEDPASIPARRVAFIVDVVRSQSGDRYARTWLQLFEIVRSLHAEPADLANAWNKSVPALAPRETVPETVESAVRRMAQHGNEALFALLVHAGTTLASPELSAWVDAAAAATHLTETVDQLRGDARPGPPHESVALLIELAPVAPGSGMVTVRAWIGEGANAPEPIFPTADDRVVPRALVAVREVVHKLVWEAQTRAASFTVEFIVADAALDEEYEFWDVRIGRDAAVLGAQYPVVLRSLERMQDRTLHPRWRSKWSNVTASDSSNPPHALWVRTPEEYTTETLYANLAHPHTGTWAFFAFSPVPDPAHRRLINAMIDGGVPIVAWLRGDAEPCDEVERRLGELFREGPKTMVQAAFQARNHAVRHRSAQRPRLALIYDDPTRMPLLPRRPRAPNMVVS